MNKSVQHAGLDGDFAAPVIARLIKDAGPGAKAIVVTGTHGAAEAFAGSLPFFLEETFREEAFCEGASIEEAFCEGAPGGRRGGVRVPVFTMPEDDPPFLRADARSREAEYARLAAMGALASDGPAAIVCPVSAAIRDICGPAAFAAARIFLEQGGEYPRDELIKGLAGLGYRRVPYTESHGEFSARGDIVDVFPVDAEEPKRISFFDTEIESIRPFDPETQKSEEGARGAGRGGTGHGDAGRGSTGHGDAGRGSTGPLVIGPAAEPAPEGYALADWLGEAGLFACLEPARVLHSLHLRETEAMHDFETLAEADEATGEDWDAYRGEEYWQGLLKKRGVNFFTPYAELPGGPAHKYEKIIEYQAKHCASLGGQLSLLATELRRYVQEGFAVTIVASAKDRLESLRGFADQEGLAEKIRFAQGGLSAGIELASEKRVWLWDGDIFKGARKSRRTRLKGHEKISAFTDIEKGDYIVHERHGIGVYDGIKTIETYGARRDYLAISYAGKDLLYLPVEQMDRVQKYVGGGGARPRVSKLGSDDWTRTKARVRAEIEEYAGELIRLAAERRLAAGFAFSPDTVWQKDFDDLFPYEPTPDQLRCFESVRRDMENPWPMDRLICGDVGYGKTEVALRAVFKCVQDGKQAAMLVPTTILASQHYRTFFERFSDFPVRVEMLSRFQPAGARRKILADLANGGVDVAIGTHALLSSNIKFKDLGLLVIDEEQRFGVRHKEKLLALRAGVDVLTLTATPIPRTLNMSLLGIKDMELIEDPPEDRYPVRTYVSEERPEVISESIRRELDRGGQAYVVYNRVSGIERVAEGLRGLAPQARIAVCHAQMDERMIEGIMQDFYEGETDVLLSTTIIESGLDIPNVNTIVILDADRLGLTQLYQLRGRVGRSNRVAFAYLMYRRDKVLTEDAEKRLRTIREFTEFGSGFKIAMKDLEIRGAGNLLGVSQHGHMAAVGYEMYCKLMEEAVAHLAGRAPALSDGENECRVELAQTAVIPPGYIDDEIVKLQAYRRISFVCDEATKSAVLEELGDRFGPVPASVLALIHAAWLRHLGEAAGLSEIRLSAKRAEFVYREAPEGLMERVFKASGIAHQAGASLEADVKLTPKLKLTLNPAASDEARFGTAASVLRALSG